VSSARLGDQRRAAPFTLGPPERRPLGGSSPAIGHNKRGVDGRRASARHNLIGTLLLPGPRWLPKKGLGSATT